MRVFRYQAAAPASSGLAASPAPVWQRRAERRRESPPVSDLLQTVFSLPKAADQAIDQRAVILLKQAKVMQAKRRRAGLIAWHQPRGHRAALSCCGRNDRA